MCVKSSILVLEVSLMIQMKITLSSSVFFSKYQFLNNDKKIKINSKSYLFINFLILREQQDKSFIIKP